MTRTTILQPLFTLQEKKIIYFSTEIVPFPRNKYLEDISFQEEESKMKTQNTNIKSKLTIS